jgi:hypothetical protein
VAFRNLKYFLPGQLRIEYGFCLLRPQTAGFTRFSLSSLTFLLSSPISRLPFSAARHQLQQSLTMPTNSFFPSLLWIEYWDFLKLFIVFLFSTAKFYFLIWLSRQSWRIFFLFFQSVLVVLFVVVKAIFFIY